VGFAPLNPPYDSYLSMRLVPIIRGAGVDL